MDDPADVSSRNGSGRHLLDGCVSTRNRKVEGSNPSSGSQTPGQRAYLALLMARRQPPVIPLGWITAPQAPLRFAMLESVWLIERPSMGLLRRRPTGK
jgi:hypothetical protein